MVTITGTTAFHLSTPELERVFCPDCGMRLFARRTNGSNIGISLAAFDDQKLFQPTEHIWDSEKISWLRLDDGLPQHAMGSA